MMGERRADQAALFSTFSLEDHVPANHLLRSIDRFVELEGQGVGRQQQAVAGRQVDVVRQAQSQCQAGGVLEPLRVADGRNDRSDTSQFRTDRCRQSGGDQRGEGQSRGLRVPVRWGM